MFEGLTAKLKGMDPSRLIAPDTCLLCQKSSGPLCPVCLDSLDLPTQMGCRQCGNREAATAHDCPWCRRLKFRPETFGFAYFFCGLSRQVCHHIKYHGYWRLIPKLVEHQKSHIFEAIPFQDYQALIPVPETFASKLRRSYNPARELALALSKDCGLPVLGALKARSFAARQTGKDQDRRLKEIRNKYRLIKQPPKSVILIDDVCTTGGTLNEITRLLRSNQVDRIAWFTLFRAI